MKELLGNLKGDKVIWSFVALLALFSFMPVFSASSNLAYMGKGTGNTVAYLVRHFVHLAIGFGMIFWVHKMPYHYFRALSKILLPIVWVLLGYTLFKGTVIDGANASRWIEVPLMGMTLSFQTSALASIVLMLYVAHYLSKKRDTPNTFKQSVIELWIPVFITVGLVLPANFSTAALIFSMVVMLTFVGQYPIKHLAAVIGLAVAGLLIFILAVKAFPDAFPNRVDTWISRIDNYMSDKPGEDDYQIEKAKIAIASGGLYGVGPGKSVQKNFLPQSSSDFIYAIIAEEYGLMGALGVLTLYLLLLFRFIVAAHKANSKFGKLVVVGLGFPIIFQALVNMGVAVEILPVTGQTLPLISSGGSSIWMTCIAIGIIIGVTKKEKEIAEELEQKERRNEALQRMIDAQIAREEAAEAALLAAESGEGFSIDDKSNPMEAVRGK